MIIYKIQTNYVLVWLGRKEQNVFYSDDKDDDEEINIKYIWLPLKVKLTSMSN